MCLALRHSRQLLGLMNKIKKDHDFLREKIQSYDKQVSFLYHQLELTDKEDTQEILKITLEQKETLTLRRKAKFEEKQLRLFLKDCGFTLMFDAIEQSKDKLLTRENEYTENPLYQEAVGSNYKILLK